MIVLLTKEETRLIFAVARKRHNDNLSLHRKDYNGAQKRNGELLHIVGALGEIATAKLLGLPFCVDQSVTYAHKAGDLAKALEIRTRGRLAYDYMFIHEKDKTNLVYIHAKLEKPCLGPEGMYKWPDRFVDVVGWIYSSDANKHREALDFGTSNFCCHERFLNSMTSCPYRQ
jgi:hypothetical protein